MPLGVPVVWREPTNHISGCSAWRHLVIMEVEKKNIIYPNTLPTIRTIAHGDGLPVCIPPNRNVLEPVTDVEIGCAELPKSLQQDFDFTPDSTSSRKPHRISQNELIDSFYL